MKLDELEKLADAAIEMTCDGCESEWHIADYLYNKGIGYEEDCAFIAAANPQTIKQLIALIRLQHDALHYTNINGFCAEDSCKQMEEALAAYEEMK